MSGYLCGDRGIDFPDAGDGVCCTGAVMRGPGGCTCWREVYDVGQQPVDEQTRKLLAAGLFPNTRDGMCHDCAYRPGSPEKQGDPTYKGDADELDRIARSERFFCHDGMRRILRWVHPSGAVVEGHPGGYDPPIVGNIPYKADGTAGVLCAGWAARRRALRSQDQRELRSWAANPAG